MRVNNLFLIAALLFAGGALASLSAVSVPHHNSRYHHSHHAVAHLGCPLSIEAFGAVADPAEGPAVTDPVRAQANGDALTSALYAANVDPLNRSSAICREVVVPNKTYTVLPGESAVGLWHVTLVLDGTLNALDNMTAWQNQALRPWKRRPVVHITDSTGVVLTGKGRIEGNGYNWWWWVVLTGPATDPRPYLLELESCVDTLIEGWTLLNAPEYHVFLSEMLRAIVQDVTVHVDIYAQQELLERAGKWQTRHPMLSPAQLQLIPGSEKWRGLPMFPLNTDGIDVSGRDIIVRRSKVMNFDDGICVKPLPLNANLSSCTENLLFTDIETHYSVGASIGSVPPGRQGNCIRNVTLRNVFMNHPIKAIYVKPDPALSPSANEGNSSGIIDSVTYENFHIESAMWWSIWVSTQQQAQPGKGTNTGCSFFYPILNTTCPTDPRVPVTNLKLRNITSVNAWLSPGVLRCNEKGPCVGWEWTDVNITTVTAWPMGRHFLCQGLVEPQFTNVSASCIYNYTSSSAMSP